MNKDFTFWFTWLIIVFIFLIISPLLILYVLITIIYGFLKCGKFPDLTGGWHCE